MRLTLRAAVLALATILAVGTLPAAAHASPWTNVWIQSTRSSVCVSVPNGTNGVAATQEVCVDLATQLWTFDDAAPSQYRIRSLGTGKCLAAIGSSTGAPIQQFACSSSTTQRWKVTSAGGDVRLVNVANGKCIGRPGGPLEIPGAQLVQANCLVGSARWLLLH